MMDLTWKVFSMTGNIDSYLLYKEFEKDNGFSEEKEKELESTEFNPPTH
ncbi:MAG: YqzL family protein [Bacillus sp. (in: Bacteria)]|nr:YqzL family protein [Bacillus sp. (in: firmicutes)]